MKIHDIPPALAADLALRQEKMQRLLREADMDGALLCGNVSLLYAVGRVFDGYVYLPAEGEALLFFRRGRPMTGEGVYSINRPEMIPQIMGDLAQPAPRRLALEGSLPHDHFQRLGGLFPNIQGVSYDVATAARRLKTPYELDIIRRDGRKQARLYAALPALYRPGMSEGDFSRAACGHFLSAGQLGIFRLGGHRMEGCLGTVVGRDSADVPSPYDYPIAGHGHSDAFPFGAADALLAEGSSVMADIPGNFSGYHVDLSRCFRLGTLPRKAHDLHAVALEVQRAVADMARPGLPCATLYETAQRIVSRHRAEEYFMGHRHQAKYIGHSLGLELNEKPVLSGREKLVLEENMVIAIEPKMLLPGVGPLGNENTYIVTKDGLENVNHCEESILPLG